nr:hypothetical protein [Tanacetum cinerariifolium]
MQEKQKIKAQRTNVAGLCGGSDGGIVGVVGYGGVGQKKAEKEKEKEKEELKTKLENFQSSSKGLSKLLNSQMSAKDKSGLGYGNQIHEGVLSYENEVLESVFDRRSSDVEDSPVNDIFTKVEGMHVVPPPMLGIYMPPKFDFGIDESKFTYGLKQSKTSESDVKTNNLDFCESNSSVETLESVPKPVKSKPKAVSEPKVWSDAPIIKEYESDSDDKYVFKASVEQEKPSCAFINTVKHVKLLGKMSKTKTHVVRILKFPKETSVETLESVPKPVKSKPKAVSEPKELKQIEADDQAIQTILLGLPEDIYVAVDSSPHQDQSSFNQNYLQQPMPNLEEITDPTTTMNMALVLMAKAFKLNYSTPTNNNQRISSNSRNRQIAQPGMNMGQDRQMQMVRGQNAGNPAEYNDAIGNQVIQNAVQNPRVQNVRNQNGLIGVQGNRNQNQIGNGNLVATQLLIAQKEEAGIQLQAEEYDLMAVATNSAPVYDTDGSAEVHEICDDNEIFNMFTQEEQYTELLEPIPESHQVPQTDNDVISEDTSVEQGGETVKQHSTNFEETRVIRIRIPVGRKDKPRRNPSGNRPWPTK